MSELMARGYNVAVPRVDTGDDVLVIKVGDGDSNYELRRMQVKTARPSATGAFTYSMRRALLENLTNVDLWFVFVAREGERWRSLLVFRQDVLLDIQRRRQRHPASEHVTFELRFGPAGTTATIGSEDVSGFLDDWRDWPSLLGAGRR
jgi:hypothetical protein